MALRHMNSSNFATPNFIKTNTPLRPCNNCTCSPGLLSRTNRRSTLFLKKIEQNRLSSINSNLDNALNNSKLNHRRQSSVNYSNESELGRVNDEADSLYSSDSLCHNLKEVNTTQRLQALRKQMEKFDIACYVIPSEDAHQSEYVAAVDQRRSFISGFSGSAGIACVTRDLLNFTTNSYEGKSILSTDGRYFNQASRELDFNWSLLRQGIDKFTWQDWCIVETRNMSQSLGGKLVNIGVDPKLFDFQTIAKFEKLIAASNSKFPDSKVALVPIETNLIDVIWDRFEIMPIRPNNELVYLGNEFSGESFQSKKKRLLNKLKQLDSENVETPRSNASTPNDENIESDPNHYFIISALDEICWLLNLRGSDIDYNPVFFSYLIINESETTLFINNSYNEVINKFFDENNIKVQPYDKIWDTIETTIRDNERVKFLIPDTSSWQLLRCISNTNFLIIHSPIDLFKSVKNQTERNNAHKAQVKDGIALIQYFAWLEDKLINKESLLDEYRAAQRLIDIRRTQKNYMGNSFETISSTGSNAAIIHYSPPSTGSSMIDPSKIYLCDSGSQFLEGTTDITRTLHFTKPTQEEIDNYTLVLKGNLAVERLKIPVGTNGTTIDCVARQFLWSKGLEYRHGTGHGIGSFLNVHEGPVGIGFKSSLADYPFQEGNIISNEPGFYKDGEYGIRIENDLLVKKAPGLKFGDKEFLEFENLTMVPYCKKLINVKLLTQEEKDQINSYHSRIWKNLVQFTQPQSITYKWLKRETSEIK